LCKSDRSALRSERSVAAKISSINGDARAIATVMSFCARAFGDDNNEQQQPPEDREIVDAFARRPAKHRSKSAVAPNSSKE
jgi:hypothetical protein